MSALGQKQTFALQKVMSVLALVATVTADMNWPTHVSVIDRGVIDRGASTRGVIARGGSIPCELGNLQGILQYYAFGRRWRLQIMRRCRASDLCIRLAGKTQSQRKSWVAINTVPSGANCPCRYFLRAIVSISGRCFLNAASGRRRSFSEK